ncbi:FISUMP domain-containing protein [Fibrobacter sp. UBA4297]|uniref:FISUMP domain-containing protein n=1 Tax=Fibrobacter sp. UBA4297 TaxID=1946536 RepID=UPI0025B95EF4|nr:FISUMP domain-containing protein [Fibrobacter sp. UBA4297]
MKQFLATLSLVFSLSSFISLTACGDDSSTSVNDDDSSSSNTVVQTSSSVTLSGASAKSNGSSSSTKKSSSSRIDSIGSSSLQNDRKSSSSSVIPASSGNLPSSSSKTIIQSSSSAKTTSSSVTLSSSEGRIKSSSSSSTPNENISSSSEYVPFDHSKTHANASKVGKDAYKQFTDPRNGRSYYYITIYSEYKGYSVTVMAENLNIGEMVLGKNDQNDDTKIERYCYNNDTTKCDEFGGLYQWAEMMQLPSRCNTESCSNLIQPNHQGICPDGWRLFTYDDYCVVMGYKDEFGYGIKGLRSSYGFAGNNYSGFSLTGAGLRTAEGGFSGLYEKTAWFRPEEYEEDKEIRAHHGLVSAKNESSPQKNHRELKTKGFSVRCVKLE